MKVLFRWRTLAVSIIITLLTFNFYVFFLVPVQNPNTIYAEKDGRHLQSLHDSRSVAAAHLQAPRRRLNKSNFTSDSLGAEGGGTLWEEKGENPQLLVVEQGNKFRDKSPMGMQQEDKLSSKFSHPAIGVNMDLQEEVTHFADVSVDAVLTKLQLQGFLELDAKRGGQEDYWTFLKKQRARRKLGQSLPALKNYKPTTNWERFHFEIRQHAMYDPESPVAESLLKDLNTLEIVDVEQKEGGTQLKLIFTLEDESQALFKPMRFPRERETLPDHFYFADFERHTAEIAAFHLDKVLGFNRVPPVAGRLLNVTHEIQRLADSKLARTFFISPAGNLCFHGQCSYYCDSGHPICGHPDQLEGSMMTFLPSDQIARRQTWRNPWKRSYSKHRKAYWEVYDDLCEKVRNRSPYYSGRRLLDIMDMSVMDFLMGNLDRHHYETFRPFGNDTFIIHLDHGRGFGKSATDEMSCLAPVMQCCLIRKSTFERLVRLYRGPETLSSLVKQSMSRDLISPILLEPHLVALDRRLTKILRVVADCLKSGKSLKDVIVDDGIY